MKKHTKTLLLISGLFASTNSFAQVTPVDPATFAGHYYTESKMTMGSKKSNELDMTFDAATGLLSGISPARPDYIYKVNFIADGDKRQYAKDTKIWYWDNSSGNGADYGKDMFNYENVRMGTFIEEGVFVLFNASTKLDDKSKMFWADKDPKAIRIMAKDKSKLGMDKMVAVQKAEDMINAAAGAQLRKTLNDQEASMLNVPNETLTKTDKALKEEITTFLKPYANNGQPLDFLCAYSTSADWTINTNSLTGAILSREIQVEMILQNRDSKNCWRNPYTLIAQYNGSGYGKLAFKSKWDVQKCDCAQVAKNK